MQEIQNKSKANWNLISLAIIALSVVFVILFLRGCAYKKTTQLHITTKEVKSKFDAVKPEQAVIHDTITIRQYLSKSDKSEVDKEVLKQQAFDLIKENKALQQMYNEASDSLKKAMYVKAIEVKSFSHTFDDQYLTATTSGFVQGDMKSIDLKYTLKPQKIEVPPAKETYLRVLSGGGIGLNKELNQFTYKLNLGFQNRKGNTLYGSYQKIGSETYYTIDYNFSIINLKR